jgi:membrane protein
MRDDLVRIGKRFIGEFQRDDVAGLSAELAYRFLFAIFPFGIFVAALTAFIANAIGFADPTSQIMGAVGDNLPAQIADVVRPQLEEVIGKTQPGLLTFGAVAALWAATGGMNALIKALNRAWEVDDTRAFLPKTALAVGLTLLGSVGLIGSFVTIVGASLLTSQVVAQLGIDQATVDLVSLLRWPLVFVLLSVAVAVLYHFAPNFRAPWKWCLVGGALFSAAWVVATAVFALYVANFANYANTYGALGGVIVLMLWFYLSAMLLVSAAAIVAATLKETQPLAVHERRVQRGVAAAGVRPTAGPLPEPAPGVPATVAMATDGRGVDEPAPSDRAAPHELGTSAADPDRPLGRRRPRLPRRPSKAPAYRMSGPEDWAVAGIVTATGATLGAIAAWLLGANRRA